jgi:LPXTG-site transpeptidase (sortase) family protein
VRLRTASAVGLLAAGTILCAAALLPYLRGRQAQEEGRRALAEQRFALAPTPAPSEATPVDEGTPGPPNETTPVEPEKPPPLPVGQPVAHLRIPAARIDTIVFEGDDADTLEKGPGHMPQTARPGQTGGSNNCVIVAHRDSYFRNLGWLRARHRIELETPERRQSYTVVSREIVAPDAVRVLAPTATPRLTLITCYPFNYVGPAPRRLVVVAEPE